MNPSFLFVWCAVLVVLCLAHLWSHRTGHKGSALAWSALTWVVVGMGLARLFVWDPVKVQGSSMMPTLSDSEVVVVDKRAFGLRVPLMGWRLGGRQPQRGDIVVFHAPDGEYWIKRVAAEPGDRVVYMRGRGWFRNGQFLAPPLSGPEPEWLSWRGAHALPRVGQHTWEWVVPTRSVFLLGDNPDVSIDSRRIGPVPLDRIGGLIQ